jgi:P-type Cu2+ transporter
MNQLLPNFGIEAAPVAQTRLVVPGMKCAGCIAKLEGNLPHQPGIVAARVHFGDRTLTITHDPALDLPALTARVAALGFEAQAANDDVQPPAELPGLLRALAVASFAAMNIMLLSVGIWSGVEGVTRELFHWLSAMIAIPAIAYAGQVFFRSAWGALRRGATNMDVPISIGIILTTAMSLFETIIGGQHAWFDGATMLTAFLLGGRVLDSMAQDRARAGVAALRRQMPSGAMVMDDGGAGHWTDAADIRSGMRVLLAVGERAVADARVESGTSSLDRSLITGESAPVAVHGGMMVEAGALNVGAPLTLRLVNAPAQSSLAELARTMAALTTGKSRYRRIADRASRLYAPAVHSLAALSFAGWMIAGAGWHQSLLIAVAVLLITCPCALGLAVPVAQVVTASALMKRGIMVKDGAALERLAEVDRALLDKTGTLTLGRPETSDTSRLSPQHQAMVRALAQASRHPLSQSLLRALGEGPVEPLANIREVAGEGVQATASDGRALSLGRPHQGSAAHSEVELSVDGQPIARFAFADRPRPDMRAALDRLAAAGISASILSGDQAAAVAPVARLAGLSAQTGARPDDKIAAIQRLTSAGHRVLMVGDGINDGPALAAAHAAIAPASASDVGRQAADIVFLGDSLLAVPASHAAARRTMRIVRQNFALAIGYNVLAVPLAIAGLVTPLIAAAAMSLSSLIVIANAMRLWRVPA